MENTPVLLRDRDTKKICIKRICEINKDKNLEVWCKNKWSSINDIVTSVSLNLLKMNVLPYYHNEHEEDIWYFIKKAKCYGFFMKWGEKTRSHWCLKHYDLELLKRFKFYYQQLYQSEFDLLEITGYFILVPRHLSDDEKMNYSKNRIPDFVLTGSKYVKLAFLDGYNTGQYITQNYKFREKLGVANMYYLYKSLGKNVKVTFDEDNLDYILSINP